MFWTQIQPLKSDKFAILFALRSEKLRRGGIWGGSEGERREAARQLVKIARRLGWRVSEFLHECEVEGPSAWHFDD